jgi:hypothetical protein
MHNHSLESFYDLQNTNLIETIFFYNRTKKTNTVNIRSLDDSCYRMINFRLNRNSITGKPYTNLTTLIKPAFQYKLDHFLIKKFFFLCTKCKK